MTIMAKDDKNSGIHPNLDDLISLKEAAVLSGLSHDHLRRLAGQGELWAMKIARNWVTTEKAVQDYVSRGKRPGQKKSH